MIIRHDGQSRSTCEFVLVDPSSDGFGHSAELGIRTALKLIVALEFERDVVRPSLLAFEKAVVESGHGSWGIYTKTAQPFHFQGNNGGTAMKTFDSFRPGSGRAAARRREREVKQKLEKLLEVEDEETFRAGLEEDFGIRPDHPRYKEMLKIWRGSR